MKIILNSLIILIIGVVVILMMSEGRKKIEGSDNLINPELLINEKTINKINKKEEILIIKKDKSVNTILLEAKEKENKRIKKENEKIKKELSEISKELVESKKDETVMSMQLEDKLEKKEREEKERIKEEQRAAEAGGYTIDGSEVYYSGEGQAVETEDISGEGQEVEKEEDLNENNKEIIYDHTKVDISGKSKKIGTRKIHMSNGREENEEFFNGQRVINGGF